MKKNYFFKRILLMLITFSTHFSFSQIKNSFDVRYQTTVRGEMTMISNNIVNRSPANTPYNTVGNSSEYNDDVNMQYIDIDTDNTTYNSSSAKLLIPDPLCSRVVHAGLYWSATYRYQTGNNPASGRFEDWNTVKFKAPGGNYVNITPTSAPFNSEVLYNSFTDSNQTNVTHGPYSCFADVTSLVANLPNPNGDYFVGNIRVSRDGRRSTGDFVIPGGVAGGWTLVVVYENINLPGKNITTFDGHAVIASGVGNLDIPVAGFITLPAPLPVRAKMGVVALEGDNRIGGDRLSIKANSLGSFTIPELFNTPPPAAPVFTNFFNSSITVNGSNFTTRNPNSLNTLGWDSHLIRINNGANGVIPNDETGVTLRATSTQDKYDIFFTSFDVEIIEPKISLIKTVENFNGNNIDGQSLGLGQEFFYSLCFENTGNDDAQNFSITDQLPTNIIFPVNGTITVGDDIIMPNGVTYSFNPTTHQLTFTVNNNLVEENDPKYCIKIKVRTPADCYDVVDACANIVTNQAYISYQGVQNTQIITDNPSYNGLDICTRPTPGATNFLTNIDLCTFVREEVLCGNSVVLTAADGYSSYVWTYDHDNNPATAPIPFPGGNTQSITVSNIGAYYVSMITPQPCISLKETINVVYFNDLATITNPIIPSADEVVICPNNGEELPKIILCGARQSEFIQTNIASATSIIWQKLVIGSCPGVVISDCPNTSSSCVWNQVATGPNYLADTAGQYRIIIYYQNGCFRTFYFNVYKNNLEPTITSTDIVCNTLGTITISGIPSGYEFSLNSNTGPWQTNNVFGGLTTGGSYNVYIRQINVSNACVFPFLAIPVIKKNLDVNIITTNQTCSNGFGSIRVQVNGVNPQYYYRLFQGGTQVNFVGPTSSNNQLFSNLNPGTYTVTATTDDGCTYTETVTINAIVPLVATATANSASCLFTLDDDGNPTIPILGSITLAGSGGTPIYNYGIYSINGTVQNPIVYQTNPVFNIPVGGQGTYIFNIVDDNNCITRSNPVTIVAEPPLIFTTNNSNITCGVNNGIVRIETTATLGYTLTYSIDGINFQSSNTFGGLAAGPYTIIIRATRGIVVCEYTETTSITQPQALTGVSNLVQQKTCLVNGIISAINVSGGTLPYTYSINGTTFQSSNEFLNLMAGTYTITIRDGNQCTFTTMPIIITPAIAPTNLNISNTSLTCSTTGSTISTTVVGGTAPFVFEIIAPSTIVATTTVGNTATFIGLASGTYTIRVTDNKGCTIEGSRTIVPIVPITLNGNAVSNVQCINTATGSLLFNVGGFSTNYSYSVNNATPITGQTSATISLTNLAAGNYNVVVTDSVTSCTASLSLTITQPSAALQLQAPFSPIRCSGPGSLNATASGGWGSYQFTLTFPNSTSITQTNGVFGSLTQIGSYTISVRDANNCVVSTNFSLSLPVNPTISLLPTSNICITSASGATLNVLATGGTTPYQYQLNTNALQSSSSFTNLQAGTYIIKVVDSFGCESTLTQIIRPQLTAQALLVKDLDCTITPNALINVNISGGLAPYQYQIRFNNGPLGALTPITTGSTFNINTANAGFYQFLITDAQGCTFQTNSITVNPIVNPTITSITQVTPSCFGFDNGSLTVNINSTLGTSPFMYSLNNGTFQTSNVFQNLTSGTYNIVVKDAKDCTTTQTVTLGQPDVLTGTSSLVQQISCINLTGTISAINVSGGTSPYEYSINGTFGNNPVFSNLTAGTYTITIRDFRNCIWVTSPIEITNPLPPTDLNLTSSAITCPSLTTTIQATAIGGVAPYTYQITAPNSINPSSTSGNTATFLSIPASSTTVYTIRVTDANSCVYSKNITIEALPPISVSGALNNNIGCLGASDGRVTFTVTGTTNYSYSINNGTVVTNQTNPVIILPNLTAGLYTILIRDLTTNCTATNTVTVNAPSAILALTPNVTQPTCDLLGSIHASATGGWGSNQFTLTYPNGTQVTQNNGLFINLAANTNPYTISVRDVNGCVVSQNFILVPYVGPTLSINTLSSDLCYDTVNAASITVNVIGGTPSYQYQIQLGSGAFSALQSNNQFNNLTSGSYTIRVIDAFNCTNTIVQVIAPLISPIATLTKSLDCTASPNATISLNVTGGTTPYQYQIKFNTGAWSTIAALPSNPFVYSTANAGDYQFQITDALGCVMVSNTIKVASITNPQISSLTQLGTILCNGNTTAGIQVNPNPLMGQSPFMYSLNAGVFQNSPLFTGLGAGVYTITIQDANFCTSSLPITISQPAALSFVTTKTDLTCSGLPNSGTTPGSITISNVIGGTQPLTYNIRNITFDLIDTYNPATNENHTFNSVDFGNYIIEVIDANGCPTTSNITIASPPNSLIAVNATANCSTGATVEVTVLAIIPGNDYEFGILNSANSPYVTSPYMFQSADVIGGFTSTFTNLVPGLSYTFVVRDNTSGCYFIQDVPSQILPSSSITFDALVSQNVTCTGSLNGNVSFTINNFDAATTSVTYTVYEAITNDITPFTGTVPVTGPTNPITISNLGLLDFGSYYVVIVEDGGCTAVSPTFTILESSQQLVVSAQVIKNPNCNPNSGTILANAQFGTPPYQYLVQSDTTLPPTSGTTFGGSTSNTLTQDVNGNQIIAGNYLVYAQDANFCVAVTPITIVVSADINPVIGVVLDNPCANENQYQITITRDPGTLTPYTYSINNGVAFTEVSNPFTVQNLSSGNYNIEITDGNGCKSDQTIVITPKALITAEVDSQPSCTTGGSVTVAAIGGTGPFIYSIQNSLGATILTNGTGLFNDPLLVPGNYTATITDQNLNGLNSNCVTTTSFSLETPTPVLFTIDAQNPSCVLEPDGQITVTLNPLNADNAPYTYTLSAPGFTSLVQVGNPVFTGLSQNSYSVTVTSSRNCDLTLPAPLTDPSPLVANDPNSYSFTCTNSGVIVLNGLIVTGGDSNYYYSIDNLFFQDSNEFTITDNGSQQNITIYVKDGKGCSTQFTYAPFDPLVTINSPSIVVDSQLSCVSGEQITVNFSAGPSSSGNYTYQLLPIMPGDIATSFTDTSISPSFTPPILTATGSYTYQITDTDTGCTLLATHTVLAYPVTSVTAQETQAIDCFGNTIGQFSFTLVNYTGSYSYEIFSSPSDTSIFTGTSSATTVLSPNNLVAGNYYVVINENIYPECQITSPLITITSPFEALDIQLQATNDRNCLTNTGTILATVIGGTAPYQYQLSNAGGIIESYTSTNNDNFFDNLANDNYTVTVKDAKDCETSTTITVNLDPTPEIDLEIVNPCASEGQFEIRVTRTVDGIAPYALTVDGASPFAIDTTPYIVTGLLSGLHTIRLTDANGCFDEKDITILPVLSGTITNTVQPSCNNDGIIDADATNGSGSYIFILQNDLGVTIAGPNNDGLFTGLSHGDYTVVITDSDPLVNCSVSLAVNLEEPTPVNYTLEVIQPSCNVLNGGTPNGSINVVLDTTNDNGPYIFELSDGINSPTIQNNSLFTELSGSDTGITYTITVTSNRGCEKIETQILQTPTPIIIPTIIVGEFGCNTTTNSPEIVTITVPLSTGGIAPYLYSFDGTNFSETNTFDIVDNQMMQNITITVKDANSCEATQDISIEPLNQVQATIAQISPITCSNDEVVQITIIGDPLHTFTYQLLPSLVAIPVTNLVFTTTLDQVGSYNYLIVDTTTNCSVITDEYTIAPLSVFEVDAILPMDNSCFNGNTGTMQFNVTGYSGAFTYNVLNEDGTIYFTGTGNTSSNPIVVNGLVAGIYTVSVSIPNSNQYDLCTKVSNSITIGQPQEILFISEQTSPVTCTNDQGVISIGSVSGGTGDYEYQLISLPSGTIVYPFNSSYAVTGFTGLAFGDYQVVIRDSNSCTENQTITLPENFVITANFVITNQDLACYGDTNASVTVNNVTNGSGEYQYALTYPNGDVASPQSSPIFENLSAGIGYFITVSDGWNCDVSLAPFDIYQPQPIMANLSLETALSCLVTPQVRITASGGTAPYFVNGQSFASTIVLNATMPSTGNGVFQYTITDSNSCLPVQTNEIVIEPIAPIVVKLDSTLLNVSCADEDNAIIIVNNTTGGQGGYSYQLQDSLGNAIGLSNTTGVFFGIAGSLIPGETYFVHVISGDCEANSDAILVTEPEPLATPIVDVINVRCAGQLDGSISITLSGGVAPYQFAVSPNLSQTIDPIDNSNTIKLTGLGVGEYSVLYQDANGCFNTITRTITQPPALVYFPPTIVQPVCDDISGSITFIASGGTPGPNGNEFSFNGNTNYVTNGTNTYTNTTDIFGDSEYEVYIRDSKGCETNLTFQTQPTVDLTSTFVVIPGCPTTTNPNANELTVFINNNLLSTTEFSLDNQTNWQSSNVFQNITPLPATHIVYIRNSNGCSKQTDIISIEPTSILGLTASETGLNQITAVATGGTEPYTYIFNGYNNGDNNVFIFSETGQQTITVIDDNGCDKTIQIPATFYDIEIPNYFTPDNGWTPLNIDNFNNLITKVFDRYGREVALLRKGQRWDGNYNGNPLPSGDYWYLIEVNNGTGRTFVGNVTLYR